jgi:hypothetical protein
LSLTDKKSANSVANVNLAVFRTLAGGSDDSTYFRVTPIVDPVYNVVSTTSYTALSAYDPYSDAEIDDHERIYTTGGILENGSVPPTSVIRSINNRIFAIDSDQKQVIYSKEIVRNEESGFPSEFAITIGKDNKDLVDLYELDEKVVVFKEDKPYYFVGDGPNDAGTGTFFSIPEAINSPVGLKYKNSIEASPEGLLFQSSRGGVYLLTRGLEVVYVGALAEDQSSQILSASRLYDKAQIRFLQSSTQQLIYDYDFKQWGVRTLTSLTGTVKDQFIWNNALTVITTTGVYVQGTGFQDNSVNFTTTQEFGWIKLSGIQGYQRVKRVLLLGEYKSAHTLTVQIGYDFSSTYSETFTFTPGATNPLQFEIQPANQKCQAIRFKITDSNGASAIQEANTLTNLTLVVGVKRGGNKLPATRRA